MNGLNEFLQRDVKEFEKEIEIVDDVLEKVAPTLKLKQTVKCDRENCAAICKVKSKIEGKRCFRYKISEIEETDDSKWSTSTNSMMLHIWTYLKNSNFLTSLIEGSPSLTVSNKVRQIFKEDKEDKEDKDVFDSLSECFKIKHNNEDEDTYCYGFHDSNTYEKNPWSSLLWFGEYILSEKKEDELIKLWLKIIREKFTLVVEFDITYKCMKPLKNRSSKADKPIFTGIDGMRAAHCFKLFERFCRSFPEIAKATICDDFEKQKPCIKNKLQVIFLNRIYQHLTSYDISDGLFDPGELTFSMEGLTILDEGQHYIQDVLIERFFAVMEKLLVRDVFWKPVKPVSSSKQGNILLPLSAEVANSLLRICINMSRDPQKLEWFIKYTKMFFNYSKWVTSQVLEVKADESNDEYYGWHSEHIMEPLHNSRFIHLWATREYYIYLMQYRAFRSQEIMWELIQRNDFNVDWYKPPKWYLSKIDKDKEEFKIKKWDDETPPEPKKYWMDTIVRSFELILDDKLEEFKVYKKIGDDFIDRNDSSKWSMLLYGPPGTGKTTIAENIAKALRWPLITITPSDFIREGGGMVEARAKQIFRSLKRMQDVVVLFDEIDRLVLDRDAPMYLNQSDTFQFMTPSMLVKLRDLWKSKCVIFIICTNYEERIDLAVKRRGRIDEQYLVLPPDWHGRLKVFFHEFLMNIVKAENVFRSNIEKEEPLSLIITDFINAKKDSLESFFRKKVKEQKHRTYGYCYGDIKQLFDDVEVNNDNKCNILLNKSLDQIFEHIKQNINSLFEKEKGIDKFLQEIEECIGTQKSVSETNGFDSNRLDLPTIRIESYDQRFHNLKKGIQIATKQEPFKEVFGLLISICVENESKKTELLDYFEKNSRERRTLRKIIKELRRHDDLKKIIGEKTNFKILNDKKNQIIDKFLSVIS